TRMVCEAAETLWLSQRTDGADIIERNLRDKVIEPDFRHPMMDGRLALARLCALQRRYDEAVDWFAKARTVLDEQGAHPLRGVVDHGGALMYARRDPRGDRARRATPRHGARAVPHPRHAGLDPTCRGAADPVYRRRRRSYRDSCEDRGLERPDRGRDRRCHFADCRAVPSRGRLLDPRLSGHGVPREGREGPPLHRLPLAPPGTGGPRVGADRTGAGKWRLEAGNGKPAIRNQRPATGDRPGPADSRWGGESGLPAAAERVAG